MNINATNNSPNFGSTVKVTRGLKRAFNKENVTNDARDAFVKLIRTLKDDGQEHNYKFGYTWKDDSDLSWKVLGSAFPYWEKRIKVQVSEMRLIHLKKVKVKTKLESNIKPKDATDENLRGMRVETLNKLDKSVKDKRILIESKNSKSQIKRSP